jgi:hypothetical protein
VRNFSTISSRPAGGPCGDTSPPVRHQGGAGVVPTISVYTPDPGAHLTHPGSAAWPPAAQREATGLDQPCRTRPASAVLGQNSGVTSGVRVKEGLRLAPLRRENPAQVPGGFGELPNGDARPQDLGLPGSAS